MKTVRFRFIKTMAGLEAGLEDGLSMAGQPGFLLVIVGSGAVETEAGWDAADHDKCWPPSNASICPVIAGASSINRIACAISSGVVPRSSKVD